MNLRSYLNQRRGLATAIGRSICVSPVLISQWANHIRNVPAGRCPDIEAATGGAVTCEELRPDVNWSVLRARKRSASPNKPNERKALRDAIKEAVDKVRHSPAKGSEGRAGMRSK